MRAYGSNDHRSRQKFVVAYYSYSSLLTVITQVYKLILFNFFLHHFRRSYCFPIRWVQKCRAFSSST